MSNDGGPAYPVAFTTTPLQGMSLRDHFAGLALQGFVGGSAWTAMCKQHSDNPSLVKEELCAAAYEFADAMLKERAK